MILAVVVSVGDFLLTGTSIYWSYNMWEYEILITLGAIAALVGAIMVMTKGSRSGPARTLMSLGAGALFLYVFMELLSTMNYEGLGGMFTDFTVLTVFAAILVIVAIVTLLLPARSGPNQAGAHPQPPAYFPAPPQVPGPAQTQWPHTPHGQQAFPQPVAQAGYPFQPQQFTQVPPTAGQPASPSGQAPANHTQQ